MEKPRMPPHPLVQVAALTVLFLGLPVFLVVGFVELEKRFRHAGADEPEVVRWP